MGLAVADASRTSQRSGCTEVHAHRGLEHRAARGRAPDLRLCSLPRFGQCPFAAGGIRRFGGRPASDSVGLGKTFELGADDIVVASAATAVLADRPRLALDTVLRPSAAEPQRTLPVQKAERPHPLSRLRDGLHRSVWPAL